ncbi:Arylsulfatase A [Yoonia tamlensis]|uniref:Arylsulfatase A n=1 Tax=Yoonia tamlensis TaxID=390270 RepID=A0A1I6HDH8_9RHOB|nr:sulfatase-like hydrolase/transferase [Yoonia tamlensis]SFR52546.1 Arylsulfatase A [Yoonia tamlensis]
MPLKKNIILFLTDQWRWDTLNAPQHPAKLPNLQKFRQTATNYTHAFTTVPLCTPARGSLFTGKLPHQNGAMDNVQGRSFYPFGKLHPAQNTYLERLDAAGYDISFIGKWHLGDNTLTDRGIRDVALSDGGDLPLMATADVTFGADRKSPYYGTVTAGMPLDEARVDAAIARLDQHRKSDPPLCLVVSLHGPHFPHHVPEKYVQLYDDLPADFIPDNWCAQFSETGKPAAQDAPYWPCQDTSGMTMKDWRRTAQHYWGFCSYIDDMFGRLCGAVTANGMDDSTVIAFTSDHGEMLGAHGWFDKGPFFYEEVMRIPLIIRTPGQPEATENKAFYSLRDLIPSLVDMAGAADILDASETARSYLRGQPDHVHYVYDAYQGRQFRFRGIRGPRYKYAWSPHDIAELYDLQTDGGERHNLAGTPAVAKIEADLKKRLFDWMQAEGDWLAGPGHHLPVGSYIDGRDRSEQHSHGSA